MGITLNFTEALVFRLMNELMFSVIQPMWSDEEIATELLWRSEELRLHSKEDVLSGIRKWKTPPDFSEGAPKRESIQS